MATHRALVLRSRDKPLSLETVPRPTAKAGQAVVRILGADVAPYMAEVLDGSRQYPLSLPMIPGNSSIGRVVEVGPDAVKLTPGQLVFCNITILARDDPNVSILFGLHGGGYPAAQKLMDGEWRDATYAEYAKFPLENLYPLNEDVLFNKLGYTMSDLCLMPVCLVPFGGLSEVDVKPGEVVIVAPATGRYGGAAVAVALAMGATVVAAGRNKDALAALESIHASTGRLRTVALTEDPSSNAEAFKTAAGKPDGADVYIDFSPPAMKGSSLLVAAVKALRPFGRLVIMGGHLGEISVSYLDIMLKSIRIQGRFMYSRQHVLQLIQMTESGVLKFGSKLGINETQEYGLESIGDALQAAANLSGFGNHVVLKP
uniref:Alcohol dehydrogenase n=1 Tax=Talaromyces marneffei PM1 TaxID=1077442 RepID=A0A093VGY0_TALMA